MYIYMYTYILDTNITPNIRICKLGKLDIAKNLVLLNANL